MLRIAVLGAGVMATALTFPAVENGNEVRLIGTHLDDDIINSIQATRQHPVLELKVDERVKAYHFADAAEAVKGADVIMSGVNSFGVDWVGRQLAKLAKPGQIILCVTKGMQADEDGTLHILPEVLKKHMGNLADEAHWAAIVGPSNAGELAVHRDTRVVFCGEEQEVRDRLVAAYRTDYYHVWTSTDFVGHEVGACMKNVFAFGGGFAAGMLDKAGQTDAKYVMYDYTAALFGEGARELKQMVAFMGGDPEVATGLGGVGDMFVTTMGGRNVRARTYVGAGVPFSQIRNVKMKGITLEGVAAIGVVGEAIEKLTRRGVIAETDYPWCAPSTTSLLTMLPSICPGRSSSAEKSDVG